MNGMDVAQMNERLKEKVLRRTPRTGRLPTAIDGFMVVRREQENEIVHLFDTPLVGVTLQGFKHSTIGNENYSYGEGHCLITGIDMPSTSRITSISPERPFLALALALNRELISELAEGTLSVSGQEATYNKAVAVSEVNSRLLDAFFTSDRPA